MRDEQLLSPEQVAERLQVSAYTAVKWMRQGRIKARKLGKSCAYSTRAGAPGAGPLVAYRLEDTAAARRDLQALQRDILIRIEARLQELAENPRPRGVERIRGTPGGLRVRVGDYRILYTVDDAEQVVTIGRVRHRRDVYRGL
jgi:mRNA interferase RelE/StbE